MNSVSITGRITKDPELKTKQDGGGYCYFCIAVDAGKDKNGEKQTEFIDCITYNQQANFLSSYAKKGDMLELCGRLHTSTKEDSEGNKIKRVTVVAFNVGICSKANKEATPEPQPEPAPAKVESKSLDEFTDPKDVTPETAAELPFEI